MAIALFPKSLSGQSITGAVFSAEDSLALTGANISLRGTDSTFIKGVTADANGKFTLDASKNSSFNVFISFAGFATEKIQIRGIRSNIDLGNIFLRKNEHLLDEVVVKSSNVINRVDKSIIIPTANQLRNSNSSLSLLQNMNLPGLYVDVIEQNVSINGSQPIYKIDGVTKTKHDILSVNPKNIARIEYEDSPSIRNIDKNVGGVINIILKKREDGGSFYGGVLGSPMTGFLNTDLYGSYNWAKSEFSVNYFNNWRDYKHRWTDTNEKFVSDNGEIERDFKGVDSPFGYLSQGVYLNYTYKPDDATMFAASFRNVFGNQHNSVNGNMTESTGAKSFFRDSKASYDSYIPSIDLYFKHNFKNSQQLEINVVGTYQDADYDRTLKDSHENDIQKLTNDIDVARKSLISEVVYRKWFKNLRLDLGYQNTWGSSKNKYKGVDSEDEKLTENNNYLYGGLSGSIKRFSYYLGTGVKLLAVKNNTDSKTYVRNLSSLNLMYNINDNLNVGLYSYYTPQLPGLSQLSGVTQTYDEILKMKGNPDLEASSTIGSRLSVNFRKGNFSSNLYLGFSRQTNTIYTDVSYSGDGIFVSQPLNGVGDNCFNAECKLSYTGILNHVNLFATLGYNSFSSEGRDFKHNLDNFYYTFSAQVYWGKWTLSGYYVKPKKTLYAQTINCGENSSQISLGFKHKNLDLFAAVKYPFEKNGWKSSWENLSKVNPSATRVFIKDNSRMLVIGVTYSLDFGKGFKRLDRYINNKDNENSILKVQE